MSGKIITTSLADTNMIGLEEKSESSPSPPPTHPHHPNHHPQLAESIDLSGLPIVGSKDSPVARRAFWLLFIVGGLAYTLYYIVDQILYYYTYPSSASVDVLFLQQVAFPSITVCNYNDIRSELFHQAPPHPKGNEASQEDLHHHLKNSMYSRHVSWAHFYTEVAHQKASTIVSCSWRDSGHCSADNFTTHYTDMGVCYTFNKAPASPLYLYDADELQSLRVVLRTDTNQYTNYTKVVGFKLVIHEPHSPAAVKQHGLSLPVGYYTNIGLTRSEIQNLRSPWGRCDSLPLAHYSTYTLEACDEACLTDYIIQSCGCKEMYMRTPNVTVCSPAEVRDCVRPHEKKYSEEKPVCQYQGKHKDQCPVPCEYFGYQNTFSMAQFSPAYLQQLADQHGETAEYWAQNALIINIYFRSMFQETIKHQEAYSPTSLLCDLGGALGLVLGASIVQVVQFVDWTVMVCCVHRSRVVKSKP